MIYSMGRAALSISHRWMDSFCPDNTPTHPIRSAEYLIVSLPLSVLPYSLSQHKWPTLGEDVEDSDGDAVTVAGAVEEVVVVLAKTRRKTGTHSFAGFLHDQDSQRLFKGPRHQTRSSCEGRQDQIDGRDLSLLSPSERVPNCRLLPSQPQG